MRTLHLIESGHATPAAAGMHSFLSISVHAAVVIAALFATARPAVERQREPETRLHFVPERPAARAPSAPAANPVTPSPRKPAPSRPKAPATPGLPSITVPPVDVRLDDPSAVEPPGPGLAGNAGSASPGSGDAGRTGPFEAGEVEVPAASLSTSGPRYPESASRRGLSGFVTARFIVDARGRVEKDVTILHSTDRDFTVAVRDFLRGARYRPARVGGRPVRQLVEQRFVFELAP